jgi:hypothetical protein
VSVFKIPAGGLNHSWQNHEGRRRRGRLQGLREDLLTTYAPQKMRRFRPESRYPLFDGRNRKSSEG